MRLSRSVCVGCSVLTLIVLAILYNFNTFEQNINSQQKTLASLDAALRELHESRSEVQSLKTTIDAMRKAHASELLGLKKEFVETQRVPPSLSPTAAQVLQKKSEGPVTDSAGEQANCRYIRFLSRLIPVPCVEFLGVMAQKHFNKLGRAAEIVGIVNGTKRVSETWSGKKAWKGELHTIIEMHEGIEVPSAPLTSVGDPVELARQHPDDNFDWIFVGSGSLHGDLSALFDAWWSKLRPMGVFSGDAYSDTADTPYLTIDRFRSAYGNVSSRAVMRAVQGFASRNGVVLHATWMKKSSAKRSDCKQKFPAWYIVKKPDIAAVATASAIPFSKPTSFSCSSQVRQLSQTPPLPCRDDFRYLVQAHLNVLGRVAEIGVFQGHYTDLNLKIWKGEYFAIDAWRWRPKDLSDKNWADPAINDLNFRVARKVMAPYNRTGRVHQIRATSEEAVRMFPNEYFDWIYVDALHTYEAAKKDMSMWWPKLRPGGFMSGDDYGDKEDTEYVPARTWQAVYGPEAMHPDNVWGVISAVQTFAREKQVVPQVTWMAATPKSKCYKFPAWYMVKPPK